MALSVKGSLLHSVVALIIAIAVGAGGDISVLAQTSPFPSDNVVVVISDGVDLTTGVCDGAGGQGDDFGRIVSSYAEMVNRILMQTNSSTGIMILQTDCLETDMATQRILKVLTTENVTGILALTQKQTTEALLAITQHLNIPVVDFASSDEILKDSDSPLHYVVPDYKYLQMQNILLAARHLNWTALSVMSSNSDSMTSDMTNNVFQAMAAENGICVLPVLPDSHVPVITFQALSKQTSDSTHAYEADILLVIEDQRGDAASLMKANLSITYNHVMFLHSLGTRSSQVLDAVDAYCNQTLNDIDMAEDNTGLCLEVDNLRNSTRNVKSSFMRVISALSFLLQMTNDSFDTFSCNTSSLACLFLKDNLPVSDPISNTLLVKEDDFQIQFMSDNSNKTQEFNHHSSESSSLYVPKHLPISVYNKTCGELCTYCGACYPNEVSPYKVITSGTKDFAVFGFFPIHTLSPEGHCNVPNPIGYAQALTFLHKTPSLFNQTKAKTVSNIQTVVFDSCGSANHVEKIMTDLETCRYNYEEKHDDRSVTRYFQPSSIIGYFDSMNHLQRDFSNENVPIFSVDKTGFSTPDDLKKTFVDNMMKSLMRIGWTTLNVIVSHDEPFLKLSQHLKDFSMSTSFCFVNEIILNGGKLKGNPDYELMLESIEKTPVFLLLTNYEDGLDVLQSLVSVELKKKISLVLIPWNEDLSQFSDAGKITHIILSLKAKSATSQLVPSIKNILQKTSTSWSNEFKDILDADGTILDKAETELGIVQRATQTVLNNIEPKSHGVPKISQDMVIKSTGLDVVVFYVARGLQYTMAHVDDLYTETETFRGSAHDTCKGWCPACHACKSSTRTHHSNLHLKGDLILTGLYPMHSSGMDANGCGPVQTNVVQLLKIRAFMFAIDTVKTRYPDLLPGLEIGGLVLDSCSNPYTALKVVANFESCTVRFGDSSNTMLNTDRDFANPTQNIGYFIENSNVNIDTNDENISDMVKNVLNNSKHSNTVILTDHTTSGKEQEAKDLGNALAQTLKQLSWNSFVVLVEKRPEFETKASALLAEVKNQDLCIVDLLYFDTYGLWRLETSFAKHIGLPVILLSSKMESLILFDWLKNRGKEYSWIIPVTSDDWNEFPNSADFLPMGTIVLDLKSKQNQDFENFLRNSTIDANLLSSMSPWHHDFWRLRFSCSFPADMSYTQNSFKSCPSTAPDLDVSSITPAVSNVIRSVDAALHSVHAKYVTKCPNRTGICENFAEDVIHGELPLLRDVSFSYQGEQLEYNSDGELYSTLSLFNVQKDGLIEIGSFFKLSLSLNVSRVRIYSSNGSELTEIPPLLCETDCTCIDVGDVKENSSHQQLHDFLYTSTQGEFIDELWAIIIVAIAGAGAFLSLLFSIYVVYKVCKGALGKRYVGLGLLLLFSLMVLYLSVLPFVFSASDIVCGLRYFLTGLSFTLCFAVILEKLMSLQNYKLIGLGGEVSGLNQFITVVFIFGVQLAFGVQWWTHESTTMHSKVDTMSGVLKYACNFDRKDFALYHVYVMFLIIICSLYAIGVRKEKKNMGEARLLLISSWICLVIWITWLLCFFLIDREWSEVIICAAILSCATIILLIVFVPKIRMVSRLKYDISQKGNLRNGYSVDTDFLYERPYSLPGTLTSTYSSSMKMSYPKTFSNFDSEVNY